MLTCMIFIYENVLYVGASWKYVQNGIKKKNIYSREKWNIFHEFITPESLLFYNILMT